MGKSSLPAQDKTIANSRMAFPLSKELKVVDLEYSDGDFISIIESDIISTNATSILLNRCAYPSDSFLAQIACRVYKELKNCLDPLERSWALLTTAKNSTDGYFGAAYWNPNCQQVVIAHKGTRLTCFNDLWADYEGIMSKDYTSQMSSAATFSNNVARKLKKLSRKHSANLTVSITGHSLGGWLAQITAFTLQYLATKPFEDEGKLFVKSKKEGFHTHTVVFDSPGCKDMLLKMESDFNIRYGGKPHLSFLLDITIYLSAPNAFNTLNSHLNVGNLYRVFIENLPTRKSCCDFFQYTRYTHKKEEIRNVFLSEEKASNEKIMKIIDWPLVKGGLCAKILEKFSSSVNEYERFHKLANCTNYYSPPPDDNEYCTLRYQVQSVEKGECSANIFMQSEYEFLNEYLKLRQFSMLFILDDLFFLLEEKTNAEMSKDKIGETLQEFEVKEGEGRGFIKCNSEEELKKLITCVKNILFILPNIHIEIKTKLNNLDVLNDVYENQSLNYLKSIEYIELIESFPKYVVDFLNNSHLQFLQLNCKAHRVLGVKNILNVLKETKGDHQTSKTFFLSLEQLINLDKYFPLKQFVKQLDKVIPVLFVVDCNIESNESATLFNNSLIAIRSKPKFKFILVSQNNGNVRNFLGNNYNAYVEKNDDLKIKFDDLTITTQKQLLEKKIYFQGEKICLGTLITDESKQIIDEEILSKLINNDSIAVGKTLSSLGDVASYYIDRIFTRHIVIKKEIERETRLLITHNKQVVRLKCEATQDIVLISDGGDDFDKLCNEYKKHNIHWLKKEDDNFAWQKSRGALSLFLEYVDQDCVSECRDIDGRIVIISSVSGAGKSTVLTKLERELKNCDASFWVVRLNLNDYTEKLEAQNFVNDEAKTFEFLLDIAGLTTPLEKKLFKYRLNSQGKIALLFDGFDEVVPKYKERVAQLLKVLKLTKVEKLWITTRPHMKKELEDILSVLPYTLKPLSKEDQVMFIRKYLCKVIDVRFNVGGHFDIYAKQLLDCMSQPISDKNQEFTGIPLHTKMLAEAFRAEFKNFYFPSSDTESNLPKSLDILDLYRVFVESKYKRHLLEKHILDLTKSGSEYETLYATFIKKYSLLALSALFCEEDINQFLEKEELRELTYYKEQITEGKENSGFISHTVGAKPIFIHYSFSEYFAALFYFSNIRREKVKAHFRDQVYGPDNKLTSIFFDLMAAEDKITYKVHIAVLNNDDNKVKQVLSSSENLEAIINATDRIGRTALHIAVAHGYSNITEILSDHGFNVNAVDELYHWRPLRYADKYGRWDIAEQLLRRGANTNDLYLARQMVKYYDFNEAIQFMIDMIIECNLKEVFNVMIKVEPDLFISTPKSSFLLVQRVHFFRHTLLHKACVYNKREFVELLVRQGADIETKDESSCTPLHNAALVGSIDIVELLLTLGANIESKNKYLETPLHVAAREGNKDVIKILLLWEADTEAKEKNGDTPLRIAAFLNKKDAFVVLLEQGADIEAKSEHSNTLLHSAAFGCSIDIVELLLTLGANIKSKNKYLKTPLHAAAERCNKDVIKILLLWGADIEAKEKNGETPLHTAANSSNKDAVVVLLEQGADIFATDKYGLTPLHYTFDGEIAKLLKESASDKITYVNFASEFDATPLHHAAEWCNEDVVEVFIAEGANIYAKDNNGCTPLHLAKYKKNAKLLIDHSKGKNEYVNLKDSHHRTALHHAADNGCKEVAEILIDCAINEIAFVNLRDEDNRTPLHLAAAPSYLNKEDVFEVLIAKGADIYVEDNFGHTPLHLTSSKKIAELLINHAKDKNAYVNFGDAEKSTPLHLAAFNGFNEVAELLIDCATHKNAYVNIEDLNKRTPLHYAAASHEGNESIVKVLIDNGANVEAEDKFGYTPLYFTSNKAVAVLLTKYANDELSYINHRDKEQQTVLHHASAEDLNVVEFLIELEADIQSKDNLGRTPLHLANSKNIAEILIIHGADIEAEDSQCRRPLHAAANKSELEVVEFLIAQGASIEARDKFCATPLHLAAEEGANQVVELLVAQGADMEAKNHWNRTPLHIAAEMGRKEVVDLLLMQDASLEVKDSFGFTPLHAATEKNQKDVVELLLQLGADLEAKDNCGCTPLHIAANEDNEDVVEFLITQGANINTENNFGHTPAIKAAYGGNNKS